MDEGGGAGVGMAWVRGLAAEADEADPKVEPEWGAPRSISAEERSAEEGEKVASEGGGAGGGGPGRATLGSDGGEYSGVFGSKVGS